MPAEYDDIINLEHPEPKNHKRMALINRAAQFAPFAALTGYDDAVNEAARTVDSRIELDEYEKVCIDEKLKIIRSRLKQQCEITITYFKPDINKAGGMYIDTTGTVKKIDVLNHMLIMKDGTAVPVDDICDIKSEWFE